VQDKILTKLYSKNKKKNRTRLQQENVPKIGVEHTKGNGEFCFYLYSLGTQGSFSKNFQPTCGSHSLMCTDV
jgi:hypothetical protein